MAKVIVHRSFSTLIFPTQYIGKLRGYEYGVILALLWSLDLHGPDHPVGHKWIAEQAGVSVSTVIRTLDSLKEKDIISWTQSTAANGGPGPNIYNLYTKEA